MTNSAALTNQHIASMLYADAESNMTLGRDIIMNVLDGTRLPEASQQSVERMLTDKSPMYDFLRALYPDGVPKASTRRTISIGDVMGFTSAAKSDDVDAFFERIFGKRAKTPEDVKASAHVEGRPYRGASIMPDTGPVPGELMEVNTDVMDELLFGDGSYKEPEPTGESSDPKRTLTDAENVLLRSTLLSQTIIGLQTLQALFDDTDFDDLIDEMIENLTEKRDSLA